MGCCLCYERPPSEERSFLKREPARRRGSVHRSGQPAACSLLSSLSGWLSSKTKNRSAGCHRWSEPLSGNHQSQREEKRWEITFREHLLCQQTLLTSCSPHEMSSDMKKPLGPAVRAGLRLRVPALLFFPDCSHREDFSRSAAR